MAGADPPLRLADRLTAEPIAEAKVEGLRQALARDHVVRFRNGSQIEYEDCERCEGRGEVAKGGRLPHEDPEYTTCSACGGEQVRLLVTRPAGGVAPYRLDTEIRAAYSMALNGPPPAEQPPGDPAEYGDDPPW